MHDPVRIVTRQVWRDGGLSDGTRAIPEETAIALVEDYARATNLWFDPEASPRYALSSRLLNWSATS